MPDRQKFLAAKRRMVRALRRVIAEHEQISRHIAWWNEHRTDASPFDAGGDLVVISLAKQMLALIEREEHVPNALIDRLRKQMRANAGATVS